MLENLEGHFAYYFLATLTVIGFYGMLAKRNLVKKLIGMTILQTSIILFWLVGAYRAGGSVPIYDERLGMADPSRYVNPLPHTLMLTAIVVAVVTLGVAFALIIAIHRSYGTLDEEELLERMR
ncbi:cation:proton antiporter subunit C [Deferrisoma camini]|uniref:cation:proton antiporter subunit C n=1 Tax=Deferrisoma camini TaxID=1035120 RepID=UPI00046D18A1|nr:cation:proton antiporter subunit C [Deferrisoma camini]